MKVSSSGGPRAPRTVPAFTAVLAAVAGVCYASWILQFFVNPGLDPVNGYVSELSATDQPFHVLFSASDFVSGLLTIIVAAIVIRRRLPRAWALAGWLALLAFGVFSVADSLFGMDCAPNSDTTCALRERAGRVSFAHQFHSVTSVFVVTAGILSLVFLTVAARRYREWPVIARWSWALMVTETVAALTTLPLMYLGLFLGIVERVQVGVLSLWLFVIAGELYAESRRPYANVWVREDIGEGHEHVNDRLPGEIITIGRDRLHVVSEGNGKPPVLLSAGLGGAWFDWIPVSELLREHRQVISFDRPGLGGSPPARGAGRLREEADRLAGLARWAGAPVIMTAHSLAGFHAEAFARLHPHLVGGMVLVDPSAEQDEPRHARLLTRLAPMARLAGSAAGLTGLPRLAGPRTRGAVMRSISQRGDVAPPELARAVYARAHVFGALLVELTGYRQMAADLLTLRRERPFPYIPLCVITALPGSRDDRWERAHADLAALSPYGRQIVLPETSHMVQIDRPDVVAAAVNAL